MALNDLERFLDRRDYKKLAREGEIFSLTLYQPSLAAGATDDYHFVVPAQRAVVAFYRDTSHTSDASLSVQLYEDSDVTVGSTELTPINANRNLALSSTVTVYSDSTVNDVGMLIDDGRILGAGSIGGNNIVSTIAPIEPVERQLKNGSNYILRFTNNSTAELEYFTRILWYETRRGSGSEGL